MASTTTMGSSAAVDLALLGLLAERARPIDELISAAKVVGGDRFTPPPLRSSRAGWRT